MQKNALVCQGSIENDFKCGKSATTFCGLLTRVVARCDEHSTDAHFVSSVLWGEPTDPEKMSPEFRRGYEA